ncbi:MULTISPECIES: hypothetical protein [unclassified Corynebacterium]|uniref:hypothetical protein n=1 Tax=unclassified Corynebacterium TaxID=2624378 RepID=UPI00114CB083|nr:MULTISPECIES: hypothetical protein [unclassified Corynebacterium]
MFEYDEGFNRSETAVAVFRDVRGRNSTSSGITRGRWHQVLFAGVAYGGDRKGGVGDYGWIQNPPSGEWFSVFKDGTDDRYIVLSDPMGFSPVYLAEIENNEGHVDLYVSNSFPALTSLLPGVSNHIDPVNVASMLGSTSTFAQTVFSQATPDERVKLVEQGYFLEISLDGWRLVPNLSSGSRYDELIKKGVEKARQVLDRVAGGISGDDQVQLRLSGGRDSRAVLALLSSSALLPHAEVLSIDPARATSEFASKILKTDARIANYLRCEYSLPISRPRAGVSGSIPVHESLVDWQRHRSNFNFHYAPRNIVVKNEHRLFDIYGGAGEAFRTHWAGFFRGHPRLGHLNWGQSQPKEIASEVFRLVFPAAFFGEGLHSLAEERFIKELQLDKYEFFDDAIDRHYVKFRNRGHNGSARSATISNSYNMMPLAQPEFYEAALLLDREDREQGKVIFDIIEHCAPGLNSVEFESGEWPRHFGRETTVRPVIEPKQTVGATRRITPLDGSADQEAFQSEIWLLAQFNQIKAELREVSELKGVLSGPIDRWLAHRFEKENASGKGILVAKLASIRDALVGIAPDLRFDTSLGIQTGRSATLRSSVPAPAQKPYRLRESLEPVEVAATAIFDGKALTIDAKVVKGQATHVEFAFYVFAGDERFYTRWYKPDGFLRVDVGGHAPTRILVFSRFASATDAFETKEIRVDDVSR